MKTIELSGKRVRSLSCDSTSRFALAGTAEGAVVLLELETGAFLGTMKHGQAINRVGWTTVEDAPAIFALGQDTFSIWTLHPRALYRVLRHPSTDAVGVAATNQGILIGEPSVVEPPEDVPALLRPPVLLEPSLQMWNGFNLQQPVHFGDNGALALLTR